METPDMPDLNLTTVVTSIIVLVLLALPFAAARLPLSRRFWSRDTRQSGPGPGFTYALVPPGGHPDESNMEEKGSWQWCLAFVPEETPDSGSEMPPWWAPAPPWDATAERGREFTREADALRAVFDETSAQPVARSSQG
ncbi:MAG: hypothetical protein F4153_06020 [Acidimicrobiia bacterium]|nr:hypothetical protein [Acidimicrobiia bacterium]